MTLVVAAAVALVANRRKVWANLARPLPSVLRTIVRRMLAKSACAWINKGKAVAVEVIDTSVGAE